MEPKLDISSHGSGESKAVPLAVVEGNDDSQVKHPRVSADTLSDIDDEQLARNPFLDPKVADHYRSVYENAQYECRHVFDPELEWTPQEEKKIVRKLDWHVCLWACIMFFALEVDRKNLGQAVSDNMLDQLGLTTDDYNFGIASRDSLSVACEKLT